MSEKLDIGRVLSSVFSTYGSQAGVLLPGALIVFLPIATLNGLISATGPNLILLIVTAIIGFIASYFFMGMVVQLVRDIQDGRRDSSLGQLFASVAPVVVPLIGASILAGLGIGVGLILLIVPGLFLLTIWALIAPSIVVERAGILEAFGRSRELVRGSGWQVFGVVVIFAVLNAIGSRIIVGIVTSISPSTIGAILGQLITNVLIAPLAALAAPTMYFELRRLKEGAAAAAPPGAPATAPQAPAPPPPAGTPPAGTPPAGTPPPGAPPAGGTPPPGGSPPPAAS
jgi:hypothetical protein